MAIKKAGDLPARSNKIRFVLVEANISDGNLSELTHAITNALKPSYAPARPALPRTTASQILPPAPNGDEPEVLEGDEVETAPAEETAEDAPLPPKATKPKGKLPLPKYLADLDVNGNGVPFKQFAEEKAPKKHMKRYLIAAAWMKEHGGSETINTDKVYTLYKTAGWPLGINDWDVTFRSAVKRDLMQRKAPGEYVLTPLGEAALQKETEE